METFKIIIPLIGYVSVIYIIGFYARKYTHGVSDFVLGGRKLSAIIVALGAGASDMSGWLLLAFPGALFVDGLKALWLPIGLALGAYLNWQYIAKRLRIYTKIANDSLTIPAYLKNRFQTKNPMLNLVASIAILIFFTAYACAGFVSGALLLNTILGIDFHISLLLTFFICVIYLMIGGFIAVSWVDFFQGSLMLFALILVPVVLYFNLEPQHYVNLNILPSFKSLDFSNVSIIYVFSMLGWALGYFGQPHILVRFMSIKNPQKTYIAKRICMTWMLLAMLGATAVGLLGHVYYGSLEHPDAVFLKIAVDFFNPYMVGILLAAVLSAIMSSIAAQLLIASSAAAEDIYNMFRKKASQNELIFINRIMILVISVVALWGGWNSNTGLFGIVQYAWSGMGSTFGPVVILSLFWVRCTNKGCIAGIISGTTTVIIWKLLFGYAQIFELNEIIPGFFVGTLMIIIVSLLDKTPDEKIMDIFYQVKKSNN